MKIKLLAAVAMSVVSAHSFAAATVSCNMTGAAVAGSKTTLAQSATAPDQSFVNTCAPDVTLYIAGSSALGGAVSSIVTPDLFDTSTQPVVTVVDLGSANGYAGGTVAAPGTGAGKAVSAWYGMSKAGLTGGTSKRLFVVYNNNNGSAAGVSQVLAAKLDGKIPESDVVTIGPTNKGLNFGTCTVDPSDDSVTGTNNGVHKVNCTTHAPTQADIAISDVHPAELVALESVALNKLSTLTSYPLGLQGFGVAVNGNLYQALQAIQLPGCTAGDATAACQPSIRRADYASLISAEGGIKSAAALLGNSDATVLTLARRDQFSGTQASSNMYFADNACGIPAAKTADLGGALTPLRGAATPVSFNNGLLMVHENATTGGVKTDLGALSGYTIGVITLNVTQPSTTSISGANWGFVKLDGVSPNFNSADGSPAYKQRTQFANGNYDFAMHSWAAVPTASVVGAKATKASLINAVIAGLSNSTQHDLTGIAYVDGVADTTVAKQSHYHRQVGTGSAAVTNNCAPFTHM